MKKNNQNNNNNKNLIELTFLKCKLKSIIKEYRYLFVYPFFYLFNLFCLNKKELNEINNQLIIF
jgi:hypothetical protein